MSRLFTDGKFEIIVSQYELTKMFHVKQGDRVGSQQ